MSEVLNRHLVYHVIYIEYAFIRRAPKLEHWLPFLGHQFLLRLLPYLLFIYSLQPHCESVQPSPAAPYGFSAASAKHAFMSFLFVLGAHPQVPFILLILLSFIWSIQYALELLNQGYPFKASCLDAVNQVKHHLPFIQLLWNTLPLHFLGFRQAWYSSYWVNHHLNLDFPSLSILGWSSSFPQKWLILALWDSSIDLITHHSVLSFDYLYYLMPYLH